MNPEDSNTDSIAKSKTQIKREVHELKELGERLVLLKTEQLQRLELPPLVLKAVQDCKKITSRSAKRRQLQYIGKLLRGIENPDFIREFFEELDSKHHRTNAILHMLEAWRERLLSQEDAMTLFIEEFPNVDRQYFRQLVKNAISERESGKPVGAGKKLFRYLKEAQTNHTQVDFKQDES